MHLGSIWDRSDDLKRSGVDSGSVCVQLGVGLRSIFGADLVSTWDRFGIDLGMIRLRSRANLGALWDHFRDAVSVSC